MTLWSTAARANVCEVDLALETDDEDLQFEFIYGEVIDAESDEETAAACLRWRTGPTEAASEAVLIAYVQGGEEGACSTSTEDRACSGNGCDEIEVLTSRSQNVAIGSGGDGVTCRNDATSSMAGTTAIG